MALILKIEKVDDSATIEVNGKQVKSIGLFGYNNEDPILVDLSDDIKIGKINNIHVKAKNGPYKYQFLASLVVGEVSIDSNIKKNVLKISEKLKSWEIYGAGGHDNQIFLDEYLSVVKSEESYKILKGKKIRFEFDEIDDEIIISVNRQIVYTHGLMHYENRKTNPANFAISKENYLKNGENEITVTLKNGTSETNLSGQISMIDDEDKENIIHKFEIHKPYAKEFAEVSKFTFFVK